MAMASYDPSDITSTAQLFPNQVKLLLLLLTCYWPRTFKSHLELVLVREEPLSPSAKRLRGHL